MQQLARALAAPPDGLSAVEYARRAGVNRTTIHRIAVGAVDPSLGTLRELAIAHGYDLRVELRPLSDPLAAAALRHLLDPAFEHLTPAEVDPASADEVERWIERLNRINDVDDAAITAGRAASLLHRDGAVYLRGDNSGLRLASAGDASNQRWAISGAAALPTFGEAPIAAPSVLWVAEDAKAAADLLRDTHLLVEHAASAHVVVARAHPSVFVDDVERSRVNYVAPIQFLLDAFGFEGALDEAALRLRDTWAAPRDGVV